MSIFNHSLPFLTGQKYFQVLLGWSLQHGASAESTCQVHLGSLARVPNSRATSAWLAQESSRFLRLSMKRNKRMSGSANLCVCHYSKQMDSSMHSPCMNDFLFYFCLWKAVSCFSQYKCLPRRVIALKKKEEQKTDDVFLQVAWLPKPEPNSGADRIVYE